jgi:hypothetical protein
MKTLLMLLILALPMTVHAEQKYNPYEKKWESVIHREKESEKPVIRYNPMTGKRHYAAPDAKVVYNPYEKVWEFEK